VSAAKNRLVRTFKLSRDPQFEPNFWDIIGLYLNPPDKALVLCCDEKSECQALERTQPHPHPDSRLLWSRHDPVASPNYIDGKIISRTEPRHTHVEWLRFLKQLDRDTPKDLDLHLILDNYATRKHAKVKRWLARHPRGVPDREWPVSPVIPCSLNLSLHFPTVLPVIPNCPAIS